MTSNVFINKGFKHKKIQKKIIQKNKKHTYFTALNSLEHFFSHFLLSSMLYSLIYQISGRVN